MVESPDRSRRASVDLDLACGKPSAQASRGRLPPLASVARAIGGDVVAESAGRVRSWWSCEGSLASIARTTCCCIGLVAAVKEQHGRRSRLVTGRAARPVVPSVPCTSSTGSLSISLVTGPPASHR
jgi:hypothetical protein